MFSDNLRYAARQIDFLKTTKVLSLTDAAAALTAPVNVDGLIERALVTPLGSLASFLGFVEKHEDLKALYEALANGLIAEVRKPEADNGLLAEALVTPLDGLA